MEVQAILDAFKENPALIEGVMTAVLDSDKGKTAISNRVDVQVQEKVDEATSNLYKRLDDDMFEILGERPKRGEDGNKEKTYEKAKALYKDLKTLREKADTLEKDEAVKALKADIEKLKNDGGGEHWKSIFNEAKTTWEQEKSDYLEKIKNSNREKENFLKGNQIDAALSGLEFAPGTPKAVIDMVKTNVKNELLQNSKLENDKLVFLTADGKPKLDPTTYEPQAALDVVNSLDVIKEITVTSDKNKGGGGADPNFKGNVQTIKVEGKDDAKKLTFAAGTFKSKTDFIEVTEKTLLENGITRDMDQWDAMKNAAYVEHNVSQLPE